MKTRALPLLRRAAVPAALVLLVLLAAAATVPSFAPGYVANWDGPGHLVRAEHFLSSLQLHDLGVFRWFPGWYLGEPMFLLYPPGFFLVPAAMRIVSFGAISMPLAMKLVPAAMYCLFAPVLYWLARRLGFPARSALAASIVSVTFSGLAIGPQGIYQIGLYTAIFSLLPFMALWGLLQQTLGGERDRRILAGLLLGWILCTSIIAGAFTLLFVTCLVVIALVFRGRVVLRPALTVAAIGFLVSFFWTFPLLESQWLAGPNVAWVPFKLPALAADLVRGRIILPPFAGYLSAAGLAACLWLVVRKDGLRRTDRLRRTATSLLVLVPVTLVVTSDLLVPSGSPLGETTGVLGLGVRIVRDALQVRAVMFLWVLLPLLAAVAVELLFRAMGRSDRVRRGLPVLTPLVIIGLLLLALPRFHTITHGTIRTVQHETTRAANADLQGGLLWLRAHAPANSVVLPAVNFDDGAYFGTYAIDSLINREAGMRSLGGQQVEAAHLSLELMDRFRSPNRDDDKEGPLLFRFGVAYVLTYRRAPYRSRYLEEVYRQGNTAVYRAHDLPADYRRLHETVEPGRQTFDLELPSAGPRALPVQYNDRWKSTVDGTGRAVAQSMDGLVQIDLPSGRHTVELRFVPRPAELAAVVLSALALLALAADSLRRLRRR